MRNFLVMAMIIGALTLNHLSIIETDDDPSTNSGTPANIGSLAFW